ncbi:hypothetical protein TNCV_445781 [Trichonephila clavipes]|nr:hypothetical protein TNCV_445781 [Trichonephila clavipes]
MHFKVPPSIVDVEPLSTLIVDEGHRVKLECTASGQPPPQYTWRSDEMKPIRLRSWQRNSPTEAYEMLEHVYGSDTLSGTQAFGWHRRFREGRESVENDGRSRRPQISRADENIKMVSAMLRKGFKQ